MLACTSRAALCTLSQKAGTPFRTFRILLLACFCFRSGGGGGACHHNRRIDRMGPQNVRSTDEGFAAVKLRTLDEGKRSGATP